MARSLSFSPRHHHPHHHHPHHHRHHPPPSTTSSSSSSSLSSSPSASPPFLPHPHHYPSMHLLPHPRAHFPPFPPHPHHHRHLKHLRKRHPKHLLKHSHKKLHKKLHKFHKLHEKLHAHQSLLFPLEHPFAHFHPCCSLLSPPPPGAVPPPPPPGAAAADVPPGIRHSPSPEPLEPHTLGFEELSLYARSFHRGRHSRCLRPCHTRRLRSRVVLERSDPGSVPPNLGSQEPELVRDEAGLQQGGSAPPLVDMIPAEAEKNADGAGPSNA